MNAADGGPDSKPDPEGAGGDGGASSEQVNIKVRDGSLKRLFCWSERVACALSGELCVRTFFMRIVFVVLLASCNPFPLCLGGGIFVRVQVLTSVALCLSTSSGASTAPCFSRGRPRRIRTVFCSCCLC